MKNTFRHCRVYWKKSCLRTFNLLIRYLQSTPPLGFEKSKNTYSLSSIGSDVLSKKTIIVYTISTESLPLVLKTLFREHSLQSTSEPEESDDSCPRKLGISNTCIYSLSPLVSVRRGRCLARLTRKRSPQDATGVGLVNTITRESNMPDQL